MFFFHAEFGWMVFMATLIFMLEFFCFGNNALCLDDWPKGTCMDSRIEGVVAAVVSHR